MASWNSSHEDAIRNVLALYAHHFDTRNLRAWLDLFTDDVHWKVLVGDQVRVELHGRSALEEDWQGRRNWSQSEGVGGRHVVANIAVLARSDTTARVVAYALVVSVARDRNPSITVTGGYDGELVKRDGRWRIRSWIISLDREP
jgi:3-phenylpropionate/cinnamic acid dioxygenase small subunit